jgi:hypothetical protein
MQKGQNPAGTSDRGPAELDQAKKNLGLPQDAVTGRDEDEEAMAAGETVEQRRRAEREAERQEAKGPRRLQGEPTPRRAEDVEEDEQAKHLRGHQIEKTTPSS